MNKDRLKILDLLKENSLTYEVIRYIEDSEALADCMVNAARLGNICNNYELFDKQLLLNCFD